MINWSAPEFEYHDKSDFWPLFVVFISFLLGLIALWQKNFLFLIFIIIAAVTIIAWREKRPENVDFGLDNRGLWIKKNFYEYKSFASFALMETGDELNSIQFRNKGRFRPYVVVPFPKDKFDEIKKHLLNFLPEVEYNESLIDVFMKILRF